jgi:hypothetical protein
VFRATNKGMVAENPDLEQLAIRFQQAVHHAVLTSLATTLGLSTTALVRLGVGWSTQHSAWSFPMRTAHGHVCGIRLRKPNAFKFAVKGGHEGLFIPKFESPEVFSSLVICEGATDVAAMLDMGFDKVVGRPSCTGGVTFAVQFIQRFRPEYVVIVADADKPGQEGARRLESILVHHAPAVRTITPPHGIKDVRAWRLTGATKQDVDWLIQTTSPRRSFFRAKSGGQDA